MGKLSKHILSFVLAIVFLGQTDSVFSQSKSKQRSKKSPYAEMSFEDMIRRYYEKQVGTFNAVEGIYSVSCVIVKKGNNLFGVYRERILERKDNYARVAILKDRPQSTHDFIEVSLSYHEADKYPIMGELTVLSEGRGLIYKHLEPDGSVMSFAMKDETDLIEGEYSVMHGRKTITYRLSYLKIYPKAAEISGITY